MARKRNVIWIFGDQHRGQALGCHGDANLSTPHLDRLAAEGVDCRGALSGFPLCCPARGTLLTGRYAHRVIPGHEYPMPDGQPTVAETFNQAGYHTAYFGKWHLDGFKEREGRAAFHIVPPERRGGFQTWVGYENNNSQWDCWAHGGEGESAFHERLPGYETDALTDLLIDYVKGKSSYGNRGDEQPFFAALSVQPPHDPYVAPAEWMQRHRPAEIRFRANVPPIERVREVARRDLAGYYAMIENLDWNVGRIREALTEAGVADDTAIVFFSDHGDMHGSHGLFRKTVPFEESIRVPLIIGGGVPIYESRRGQNDLPISLVDLAPTTLGLCDLEAPGWMEGADYSYLWSKEREAPELPDSAYLQLVAPTGHGNSMAQPYRGVVTRDGWKYVAVEGQPLYLFNLDEDPYELANQAFNPLYRLKLRELNERTRQWVADTKDEFRLPEI